MLRTITSHCVTVQIDTVDLGTEFIHKFADRFILDYIDVVPDTNFLPGTESIITGKCTAHNGKVSLSGLQVHDVDFSTRRLYFSMSVHAFNCVSDAVTTELLQIRKMAAE